MHRSAVGTVKLIDLGLEMAYDIRRQGRSWSASTPSATASCGPRAPWRSRPRKRQRGWLRLAPFSPYSLSHRTSQWQSSSPLPWLRRLRRSCRASRRALRTLPRLHRVQGTCRPRRRRSRSGLRSAAGSHQRGRHQVVSHSPTGVGLTPYLGFFLLSREHNATTL
jgi:hypothetical protein